MVILMDMIGKAKWGNSWYKNVLRILVYKLSYIRISMRESFYL